jgi:hypothetical protein
MPLIEHDIWKNPQGDTALCIKGFLGLECSDCLDLEYTIASTFKAESHFEAMVTYYKFMGWGEYQKLSESEMKPYEMDDLLQRAVEYLSVVRKEPGLLKELRPIPSVEPPPSTPEQIARRHFHSVIIHFAPVPADNDIFYEFVLKLDSFFENREDGYYDGHETAMDDSEGALYFYGPDGEALLKTLLPLVNHVDFLQGAEAVIRFGASSDENARQLEPVLPVLT